MNNTGCGNCDLCRARALSIELRRHVHPWELMYGLDSPMSFYIRKYKDEPIWMYDRFRRAHKHYGREVTREEANDYVDTGSK